jgi:hypothetical protein
LRFESTVPLCCSLLRLVHDAFLRIRLGGDDKIEMTNCTSNWNGNYSSNIQGFRMIFIKDSTK